MDDIRIPGNPHSAGHGTERCDLYAKSWLDQLNPTCATLHPTPRAAHTRRYVHCPDLTPAFEGRAASLRVVCSDSLLWWARVVCWSMFRAWPQSTVPRRHF